MLRLYNTENVSTFLYYEFIIAHKREKNKGLKLIIKQWFERKVESQYWKGKSTSFCWNLSIFGYGLQKRYFRQFCVWIRTLTENEILADARMKSANADEIFGFASDEIKSTHPPSRRISSNEVGFHRRRRFHPPARVDLVEKPTCRNKSVFLAGIAGLEPAEWRSQNPLPYQLGYIPTANSIILYLFWFVK